MTELDMLDGLAKSISPVTRLTKSFANQKTNGIHMVDLVDRVNFQVIAATVYEPYADHILAAVNALPDLIAAARERDAMREYVRGRVEWHERLADMSFDAARECSERGEIAAERIAMDRHRIHSEQADEARQALNQEQPA